MKLISGISALLIAGSVVVATPVATLAQDTQQRPPVTLDLRDAPIREALEQLFKSAKVEYALDNAVGGYVTLSIREQPFENALRLILRASAIPLRFTVENNVYIVSPRPIATEAPVANTPPPLDESETRPRLQLEQIQLVYVDPLDLSVVLGQITPIPVNIRGQQAGGGGFGGGGLGGGFGGFGGGGLGGGIGGFGGGGLGGGIGGFGGGGLGGGIGGGFIGGGRGF